MDSVLPVPAGPAGAAPNLICRAYTSLAHKTSKGIAPSHVGNSFFNGVLKHALRYF